LPLTIWTDKKYSSTEYGTAVIKNIFGTRTPFDVPKSLYATKDCLHVASIGLTGTALDCFAGSGTTGHAIIALIREDGGSRKYLLMEMGSHFETVMMPRMKKVIYSSEWRDGKPVNRDGVSHAFTYIRLESYEDALNNLEFKRTKDQTTLLDADAEAREQYILSYMLDVESRGIQSLLNIDGFRNPDQYKLHVERNGETQLVNVDLVETYNWLLGLTVKHIDVIRGVRVVEGKNPDGDRVLVLWRDLAEMDNDKLDEWFKKQGYTTRDLEYDLVYVNGDNNLENLRRPDQTWKVRLIEEEFRRLTFDVHRTCRRRTWPDADQPPQPCSTSRSRFGSMRSWSLTSGCWGCSTRRSSTIWQAR
jgi:adenine-specific DNA-methyltransferase